MPTRAETANWYDVLAFLTLASLLGLFIGVVLGSVALLLARPAYGSERHVPALQVPAHPAAYPADEADESETDAGGVDVVLPACEGQALRTTARRLEM